MRSDGKPCALASNRGHHRTGRTLGAPLEVDIEPPTATHRACSRPRNGRSAGMAQWARSRSFTISAWSHSRRSSAGSRASAPGARGGCTQMAASRYPWLIAGLQTFGLNDNEKTVTSERVALPSGPQRGRPSHASSVVHSCLGRSGYQRAGWRDAVVSPRRNCPPMRSQCGYLATPARFRRTRPC